MDATHRFEPVLIKVEDGFQIWRRSAMLAKLVNRLPDSMRPWSEPALSGMRLGPENNADNPLMLQFFTWDSKCENMSWWKHFESEVPRLAHMGFTQVWLPPPNKAMNRDGRGYDAYDLWDLGEFDQKGGISTRWGTKDELISACATARRYGIDVIIDAVLNHKMGGDRCETLQAVPVDPKNRDRAIASAREIEGWTAFDFPGRGDKYSSMRWTHEHFTGIDWDHRTRTNAIYRIAGSGHHGWSRWVDRELGNYDYLLGVDIDHRHPRVREDLHSWGSWVLEATGATGFRLDAVKHMDRRFLLEFIMRARSEPGRERLFAVAEYWSGNVRHIIPYITAFAGQVSFFDVPLHNNFHQASKRNRRYDLRTIFHNTVVQIRPGDAVTFVDNHDTQIGQALESWVDSSFKLQAYALILLRSEGHPCVFYGDLYPNHECYDPAIAEPLERLIQARKAYAYGPTKGYSTSTNCVGWVRTGTSTRRGCVVLISNDDPPRGHDAHQIRMDVGVHNAGSRYRSFLSSAPDILISPDGSGSFMCPPNGVQVWVKADEP